MKRMKGVPGVLILSVLLCGVGAPVRAQSTPDDSDVVYLEAYLFDSITAELLVDYGPMLWQDQLWLLSDVPMGPELSLVLVAFNLEGRPVLEGELDGIWLDPFYAPFGMGFLLLGVEQTGIRVISDRYGDFGELILAPVDPIIEVDVDIRPGSKGGVLNLSSGGILPVAVLGSSGFDVSWIDAASLRLAGVPADRVRTEDVTGPAGVPDGILDLVMFVPVPGLNAVLEGVTSGETVQLVLDGKLADETRIEGRTDIRVKDKSYPPRGPKQR